MKIESDVLSIIKDQYGDIINGLSNSYDSTNINQVIIDYLEKDHLTVSFIVGNVPMIEFNKFVNYVKKISEYISDYEKVKDVFLDFEPQQNNDGDYVLTHLGVIFYFKN